MKHEEMLKGSPKAHPEEREMKIRKKT